MSFTYNYTKYFQRKGEITMKELSTTFTKAMEIGAKFNELYGEDERTSDWSGSEECSEMTKKVIELMEANNELTIEQVVKEIVETMLENSTDREDHMWDDYCKGFLAGQILGLPTEENISKVNQAEELWDNNHDYGYYQEVLNEVLTM